MAYCVLLSCPCLSPTSFFPSLPLFALTFFSSAHSFPFYCLPSSGRTAGWNEESGGRKQKGMSMSEGCRVLCETVKEKGEKNWQINKRRQRMRGTWNNGNEELHAGCGRMEERRESKSRHSVWDQTGEDGSGRKDGVVNNDCSELRP